MLGQPPSRARLEMAPATTVGLLPLPAVSSLGCRGWVGGGSGRELGRSGRQRRLAALARPPAACRMAGEGIQGRGSDRGRGSGLGLSRAWPACCPRAAGPACAGQHRRARASTASGGGGGGGGTLGKKARRGARRTFCMRPSVARLDLEVTYSARLLAMDLRSRRSRSGSLKQCGRRSRAAPGRWPWICGHGLEAERVTAR